MLRQNTRSTSRRAGGRPGDRIAGRPVIDIIRSEAGPIARPPLSGVLRRPVESAQYCSQDFADLTTHLKVRRSVGRTGVCYDNAWAESFNGTLKVERVNRTSYPTREQAEMDITRYIELRYNQVRLHSALGYITPNEAEQWWLANNSAA
ncbi:integrase core domain-containing protein [Nakamurella sp. PAMC28650]|uniref:integrase core domain-containing protein n=1 Tax=Nakamurella sp. PAMC28650 TaxID=2762325 RepID=UPI00351B93A6